MPSLIRNIFLIVIFFIASCAPIFRVGQDYKKPNVPIPKKWYSLKEQAQEGFEATEDAWWENFNDPLLNYLIALAVNNNYDYKIAISKVMEARANVDLKNSELLPKVNLSGSAARRSNFFNPINPNQHRIINFFTAGFDASWELDLFGGNYRAKQSAKALWEASNQAKNYILVSLIAEVVKNYIDYRNAQNQFILQSQINKNLEEILELNKKKKNSGLIGEIEFSKIKIKFLNSKSSLVDLRSKVSSALYNLELLLGKKSGEMAGYLSDVEDVPLIKKDIVFLAPVALIRGRPDVMQAELELKSATELKGYTIAQVFPKLSFTGFFGFYNTKPQNLLNSSGRVFSSQFDVKMPVINFGGLRAGIKIADERKIQALLNYESRINQALFDVESAIVNVMKDEERLAIQKQNYSLNKLIGKLNYDRKKKGIISQLDYLLLDIDRLQAQQELSQVKFDYSLKVIAFYKSLGGGWLAVQ